MHNRRPQRVDTVEKVGHESRVRNNRIEEACYSNQRCAGDWFFESKLRGNVLKIFFQQYRSLGGRSNMLGHVRKTSNRVAHGLTGVPGAT